MSELRLAAPVGVPARPHELRAAPMRPLVRLRPAPERTLVRLERLEPLHHARELALGEARARVAHVDEVLALVHAEQERAEVRAHLARLGPSADDELLFVQDLELAPVRGALARLVQRQRVLRDQPFPAALHRLLEQCSSVAAYDVAEEQERRSRTAEHPFERGAALDERTSAKVRPAVAQEVEGDEGHSRGAGAGRACTAGGAGGIRSAGGAGSAGAAGRAGCVRIDHVDSALKLLKACRLARAVERDDLT